MTYGFGGFALAAQSAARADWVGPVRLPSHVLATESPAESTPYPGQPAYPRPYPDDVDPQSLAAEGDGLEPPGDLAPSDWHAGEPGPPQLVPPDRAQHRIRRFLAQARRDIRADHIGYYSWPSLRDLALGVIIAAPLANTSLDEDFQQWYQQRVRTRGTDDLAAFWKTFGEGQIFIPSFAVLAVVGSCCPERPLMAAAGDYSGRVARAYLVGAPPMLLMQFVLGAGRPDEYGVGSQWRPFQDTNGVSGHAFVGSVPFITAAQCVDGPLLKGTLYVLSAFPAWSRINDDAHYLSQAMLGWWMGYLACRAVNQPATAEQPQRLLGGQWRLAPLATPEMTGLGIILRR